MQCVRSELERFILAMQDLCSFRRLQLNPEKTDMIWFESKNNLMKLQKEDIAIQIGTVVIKPSNSVRDLGVLLDNELTLRLHINKLSLAVCLSITVSA